jgi:hypothetical protein
MKTLAMDGLRPEAAAAEAAPEPAAAVEAAPAAAMTAAPPGLSFIGDNGKVQQAAHQQEYGEKTDKLSRPHDLSPFFFFIFGFTPLGAGAAAILAGRKSIFWAPVGGVKVNRLSASWGEKFQSEK